jgi:hypothetical protein
MSQCFSITRVCVQPPECAGTKPGTPYCHREPCRLCHASRLQQMAFTRARKHLLQAGAAPFNFVSTLKPNRPTTSKQNTIMNRNPKYRCARRMLAIAAVLLLAVLALLLNVTPVAAAPKSKAATPEQIEFFEKKIRPVLAEKCYECHSEEAGKNKGEFVLDSRDGIRAGGDRGPAIVPNNVDESILIRAIRQEGALHMPPERKGGKLPDEVIADFEEWVKMGAPDPRDAPKVANSEPAKPEKAVDWDKARTFWSFQKPKAVSPPAVAEKKWPKTDVDHFVLAKLEEKGLKPVKDADLRTLARRVYYDLTGLPPTPAEVDAFAKDRSPDAYKKLVDKLLASSRFGEQWGRHWLDVARYGESTGLDRNLNYPYAWKYRDYVIQAFNQDKPYNRFVLEQLAGDLLPSTNQVQRDEQEIATGFLAIGPKGLNETRPKYSKWQVVDDQIDATSRGFLGLTVGCARCHDHKFDPIPTRDYHAMAGIFASTDTLYGTVGGRGNRRPTSLLALDDAPDLPVLFTREPTPNMFVNTNRNFAQLGGTNATGRVRGTNGFGGGLGGGFGGQGRRTGQATTNQIERVPTHLSYAMGVRDLDAPQDSPIYYRGDLTKPKDVVPRGFPRIVALSQPLRIPEESSGRLQLAQWITDPENPLTARVAVNRVWQHLFGEGIVSTPDNLGQLGARPTHPELLDYLAVKFVTEQKWSVKELVRSLVLSRTYQLSSDEDAKAGESDPADTLLWRAQPRRLTAEQLRDTILAASGRLDVEPPQYAITAEFGDGYYGVNIWESDFPTEYFKRSVYLPIVRDMVPDSLSLFDFPNPNLVGAHREQTTSPSQALFMMNNALVQNESLHVARRVLENPRLSDQERVRQTYLAALLREPTAAEVKRARQFIQEQEELLASAQPETLTPRTSTPETDGPLMLKLPAPQTVPQMADAPATPAAAPVSNDQTPSAAAGAGGGGRRLGRQQVLGPGSSSATVVAKLAPGVAQPKLYQQPVADKPADPQEGAWSLFTQALFASAEFRYLQ